MHTCQKQDNVSGTLLGRSAEAIIIYKLPCNLQIYKFYIVKAIYK